MYVPLQLNAFGGEAVLMQTNDITHLIHYSVFTLPVHMFDKPNPIRKDWYGEFLLV